MDIEFARHVVRASFASGRILGELVQSSKAYQAPEAHKPFAIGLAKAIHEMQEATMNKAFAAFPELEAEVDAAVQKFGRY